MTYTAHNAQGIEIAQVNGISNAARLFVSCPDVFCLRTPGVLELDALYLIGEAIPRTCDNVVKLLSGRDEWIAGFFA